MAPNSGCSKKKKIEEVIFVQQRNNLMTKMTERERRPWSDLPADLLMNILARNYSPADQIRFRAVCKSWQQLPIDHDNAEESAIQKINKLPWVVTGDWTENDEEENEMSWVLSCKLFDPKHPNPYYVNKILFEDCRSTERTRICSSKHGWLLFEKTKHINPISSFFLFSPFTQQFIHLPDLFIPDFESTAPYATFSSSDPHNDPDCEFLVLCDYFYRGCGSIAVSKCRRGDQYWNTRVFDKKNQVFSIGTIKQVLYTQLGYLCCLSYFGSLVAYRVTREDWIQLIIPQVLWNTEFEGRNQLIECKGGLLLVMLRNSIFYDSGCRLFKFSWSSSMWSIESSLPNHAIFVGPTSFLVPASGDIANKIYYHDLKSDNLKFYCLKDGKSHKYLRAAAAADDDDSLHRGWLAKGTLENGVTWIQSPKFHTREAF